MQSKVCTVIFWLFVVVCPTAAKDNALTLAFARDWQPYVYLDSEGNPAGQDYELLQKTLARMDYTLKIEHLPEQRLGLEILHGMVDITLGAAKTPERQNHNYYSIPYRSEVIVFGFVGTRTPQFGGKELATILEQGYLVTVNKSGWFGHDFNHQLLAQYDANLIHAEGTLRRMQLLKMNRVDAIIGDAAVLREAASQLGIDNFTVSDQVIHRTDVYFMFGHDRIAPDFVNKFNQALRLEMATSR